MKKFKNVSKQRPKDTDTKKKIACAERIKQQGSVNGKKRKAPKDRSKVKPKKRTRRKSSQELERENVELRKECDQLKIEKKDLKSSNFCPILQRNSFWHLTYTSRNFFWEQAPRPPVFSTLLAHPSNFLAARLFLLVLYSADSIFN